MTFDFASFPMMVNITRIQNHTSNAWEKVLTLYKQRIYIFIQRINLLIGREFQIESSHQFKSS